MNLNNKTISSTLLHHAKYLKILFVGILLAMHNHNTEAAQAEEYVILFQKLGSNNYYRHNCFAQISENDFTARIKPNLQNSLHQEVHYTLDTNTCFFYHNHTVIAKQNEQIEFLNNNLAKRKEDGTYDRNLTIVHFHFPIIPNQSNLNLAKQKGHTQLASCLKQALQQENQLREYEAHLASRQQKLQENGQKGENNEVLLKAYEIFKHIAFSYGYTEISGTQVDYEGILESYKINQDNQNQEDQRLHKLLRAKMREKRKCSDKLTKTQVEARIEALSQPDKSNADNLSALAKEVAGVSKHPQVPTSQWEEKIAQLRLNIMQAQARIATADQLPSYHRPTSTNVRQDPQEQHEQQTLQQIQEASKLEQAILASLQEMSKNIDPQKPPDEYVKEQEELLKQFESSKEKPKPTANSPESNNHSLIIGIMGVLCIGSIFYVVFLGKASKTPKKVKI